MSLVLAAASSSVHAKQLNLADKGTPLFSLVAGDVRSWEDQRATLILQGYLERIIGERPVVYRGGGLPTGLVIMVGKHPEALKHLADVDLRQLAGTQGYVIRAFDGGVLICGLTDKGTRNGVYGFLQMLGCRFYMPGPDGEVIPHRPSLSVDADLFVTSKPAVQHRDLWLAGFPHADLDQRDWNQWYTWIDSLRADSGYLFASHNYVGFCDPDDYAETHPEYFPLIDDERRPHVHHQLCLSNPAVVALAVQHARRYFERNPAATSYSLTPNDGGMYGWCQCDACRAMDDPDPEAGVSGRIARFNNAVAEQLWAKYPDKRLAYLGDYANTGAPSLSVKLHPMVLPGVVNMADTLRPMDDPASRQNAAYRERLARWQKVSNSIYFYEYLGPGWRNMLPQLHTLGQRIRWYTDRMNVVAYSGEIGNYEPTTRLEVYLAAQMLWDPSQDPAAIVEEFITLYFGEAADPMRQFFDALPLLASVSLHGLEPRPVPEDYQQTLDWLGEDGHVETAYNLPATWHHGEELEYLAFLLEQARAAAVHPLTQRRIEPFYRQVVAWNLVGEFCRAYAAWTASPVDETRRGEALNAGERLMNYLDHVRDDNVINASYLRSVQLDRMMQQLRTRSSGDSHE